MEKILVCLTFFASILALIFVAVTAKKVLKASEGNETMQKIAGFIRKGANAYLKRQYKVVSVFFACMFVVLCVMAYLGFT